MKLEHIFEELLNEASTDDYKNRKDFIAGQMSKIKSELEKIMGSSYTVLVRPIMGSAIAVDVYKANTKVTRHNDLGLVSCMIDFPEDISSAKNFSWESQIYPKKYGVTFRKITSGSIEDTNKKLYDWFKKNKPALDKIEK